MKIKITLLLICMGNLLLAQTKLWTPVSETTINTNGERLIVPIKYKTFHADMDALETILSSAPHEQDTKLEKSGVILELPMPDGSVKKFRVIESPVMEPGLAANYPGIQTYNVMGIDQPGTYGKLDITPAGFHGMLMGTAGTILIDPYSRNNTTEYIAYYAADAVTKSIAACQVDEAFTHRLNSINTTNATNSVICAGATLRTYRLAISCTGEFAQATNGGTSPTRTQLVGTITGIVTRLNMFYETEAAIRLVLINNDSALLFTDPNTDPYPFLGAQDSLTSVLLDKNQNVTDSIIGSANYDLGHLFVGANLGGLAGVGVVCTAGQKSHAASSSSTPSTDINFIGIIQHEMGHEFGCNHSFNECTTHPAQAPGSMFEPGGGVTIMGYPGVCGTTDDIATTRIHYFHALSFDQLMVYSNTGNGNSCAAATTSGNNPPSVSNIPTYTIPISTPFQLTGKATDPDGDMLTYSWEEIDNNSTAHALGTAAPYFRSFEPVDTALRTFPKMSDVMLGKTSNLGEYLPSTAQTLNFRLTARDNKTSGGGVCSANTQVVVAATGPFAVTSQATPTTWNACSTQTITWDIAGTNAAPINATLVDIYITLDTGKTITPIATSIPNTGTCNITVPTLTTTHARIIIKAENNIFFAVNAAYITISGLCADFQASASGVVKSSIDKGGALTFTDLSAGNPISWNWTFAGGTPATSTAQNPVITYNSPGTFSVTLIISDGTSKDTATKKNYVTVGATYNKGTAYTCIAIDTNNNIWAATNKLGVFFLNKKTTPSATQFAELVFSTGTDPTKFVVQSIACDSLGNTWIADGGQGYSSAVGGGLERIDYNNPGTLQHYIRNDNTECIVGNVNDGLATRNIQSVVVDRKNTVWCAQKYDDLTVSPNYYVSPGSFSYKASSSTAFTTKSTWADRQNGVEPPELPYPAYVCNPTINQTAQTRTCNSIAAGPNEVWVSVYPYQAINGTSFPAQILRYDLNGNFIAPSINYATVGVPTAGGVFNGIYLTPKGDAWVTIGNKGFGVRINGAWKFMALTDMPCIFPAGASINQNAIWGNKFGNVYIGTTAGLIVYNGDGNVNSDASYSFYALSSDAGASRSIMGGVSEKDSIQWIATNDGIVRTVIGKYDMTAADIDYTSCNIPDMNNVEAAIASGENNQSYHSYEVTTIICDKKTSKYPDHCTAEYVYNMLKNNVNFTAPTPPDYPTNVLDIYKQANGGVLFTLLTVSPFVKAFDSLTTASLSATQNSANPGNVISCTQQYKLYNNAKSIVARYLYAQGPSLRYFKDCSWLAGLAVPFDYFNSMDDYCGKQLLDVQYDPIWIFANDKKKIITNYTATGHILYPGKVERTVVEECGVVKIITRGVGTQYCGDNCRGHLMGQANIILGKYLFNAVDIRLKTAFENGQ
jgi:PKD repeat protein